MIQKIKNVTAVLFDYLSLILSFQFSIRLLKQMNVALLSALRNTNYAVVRYRCKDSAYVFNVNFQDSTIKSNTIVFNTNDKDLVGYLSNQKHIISRWDLQLIVWTPQNRNFKVRLKDVRVLAINQDFVNHSKIILTYSNSIHV